MGDIGKILSANQIIPVVVLERLEDTVPLCEALLNGGLKAIEITLRTEVAMACIGEAVKRFPEMSVGAGTVLREEQVTVVKDLGVDFGVSPGLTPQLCDAVRRHELPFLPGGATVSEFMVNADAGFTVQKFFPAEPSGGSGFLKSITSPLAGISFCPTGGINAGNAAAYLSLPNVIAVGGSWFVKPDLVAAGDWDEISKDVGDVVRKFGAAGTVGR